MKKSKVGFFLSAIYLLLVAASIFFALYQFNFDPANSELSAVPCIVLTLPWSLMAFTLLDSMISNSLIVTFTIISLCTLLNAVIFYLVGVLIESLFSSRLK